MSNLNNFYLELLNAYVVPALGCTEPVSVAFASAKAREILGDIPDKIDIVVSGNLYKNAMGVFVPGTGMIGLNISCAAGIIAGDSSKNLEVLAGINSFQVEEAKKLINKNIISIRVDENAKHVVYTKLIAKKDNDEVEIIVENEHTHISFLRRNNEILIKQEGELVGTCEFSSNLENMSINDIYDFSTNIELSKIEHILSTGYINSSLANEGMKGNYGLRVGKTIQKNINLKILSDDLLNKVTKFTSAASDARMGGASLPAVSNYGSGNQGILCTMPVWIAGKFFENSIEEIARALVMSHLLAIYIKMHMPKLSAFCGNTSSGAAASFAIVYLMGGSLEQSKYSMLNVLGDTNGMICDGAKAGCALKVSTAATSAIKGALLGMNNIRITKEQGIIDDELEITIDNIALLVEEGFKKTDSLILDIMMKKSC